MSSELYDYPDLYDALLRVEAHLPFYAELARQHPDRVLELACGTGQITVPVAGAARRVVGLDLSAAMLASARARAAAAGAACTFVAGDMRHFDLGETFDLIFIARNSLLHVLMTEDLVATFRAVRAHLAPGGVFVFDVFNPSLAILGRPRGQRFRVMEEHSPEFGHLLVESTHGYEADRQVDYCTWYVSTDEQRDKWVMPLVLRSIFPQELPLLVEAGGLVLTDRFGDLQKHPFASASPQQVCVCRAAAGPASPSRAPSSRGEGER